MGWGRHDAVKVGGQGRGGTEGGEGREGERKGEEMEWEGRAKTENDEGKDERMARARRRETGDEISGRERRETGARGGWRIGRARNGVREERGWGMWCEEAGGRRGELRMDG